MQALSDELEYGYNIAVNIEIGQDHREIPASIKVAVELLKRVGIVTKGYRVHTDNWYSSPSLFHYL